MWWLPMRSNYATCLSKHFDELYVDIASNPSDSMVALLAHQSEICIFCFSKQMEIFGLVFASKKYL